MSIKVGDKFIIEVGTIAELSDGKKKYFIKPFESLVFDRKGLEQLERLDKATGNIYQTGYEDGKEDGYACCRKNTELIHELKQAEYDKGYNNALDDIDHAIDVLKNMTVAECKEWFEFENCIGIDDVVCEFTVQQIIETTKAYEEKKEAEIKVGDEVISLSSGIKAVVTMVDDETVFVVYSDGICGDFDKENFKKTGRTIKEIIQSLDELRGAKSEE